MNDDFKRPLGSDSRDPKTEVPVRDSEPAVTRKQTVVKEKKRYSKAFSFVSMLLLLAILGAGVLGYLWYEQDQQLASLKDEVGNSKATIADLRSELGKNNETPVEEPVVTGTDDKSLIIETVTARAKAPVSAKDSKATVNIMKQGSEFAYTNVGFEGGGGAAYILKKVDDTWTIIFSGQDVVPESVVETFGIPAEYRTGQ